MIAPTPPHGSPPPSPPDSTRPSEPPPERPDPDKLGDEIADLAAHIDAARYRLLVLIRQFAELERWGPGFKSCDHWLSWRIGISLPTAREHVRVARALAKLPLLSAAMERGQISYSRARAITRVATAENEERLVGFAWYATAMQLESLVRGWRKVDRLEDEQVRHERRHLMLYADEDGSYVVRGRLDPEVGEQFARAMDTARSVLYREKQERTRLENRRDWSGGAE